MGCPSCGADSPTGARFCNTCGTPLAALCPGCGNGNPPGSRFCNACGQALGAALPSDHPEPAPPPRSYTPRYLAERILSARADLDGERKQVTVLFADVVGSTELIRGRDAEEAQGLLDGVVTVMMDAVHRYEGTVSRLMGDGLMAMFGAPVAHEDHAVRAGYAALAMLDGVRCHAEAVRRAHGVAIAIRVGVSSGEVVVRTIRDDLHMDYTAMGETVHLASRMEQLAEPGTAVLTAETQALVDGYLRTESLGRLPVKGLDAPIEVHRLLGEGGARSRLQVAAGRGLTRFAGRRRELDALHAVMARARSGHGQVAALVGEPGVGKSRLIWELTRSEMAAEWQILQGHAVSYGSTAAYLPIADLLRRYCRIEGRDDPRVVREKVLGTVLDVDERLRSSVPALLSLLDVDVQDPAWDALDPPRRRQETLGAVTRLLLRASQDRPLLLVFEDLHWIDAETQAVLDRLVDDLPAARLLLLVSYRPEYRHAWSDREQYTRLRLDPLPTSSADELLADLLGDDPTLGPVKALLAERTAGNPLFLEESVRALVESGAVVGERGPFRLARPVADVRVPATVQAVLAARIDRLPPEDKRLLQSAAAIGRDVPLALLRAVAQLSDAELQAGLARLQAAELLFAARLFPEPEYTFKHALTHEVAYGGLLQERRRTLHARVVDAIERLHADRLDEHVERLAHHASRGEIWEKALAYARQAGAKGASRSALREAAANFDQALEALRHLPETRESRELAVDIRLDLRSALYPLGELERIIARLREAEAIAEALGDRGRLARVAAYLASLYFTTGRYAPAIASAERTATIGQAHDDLGARILGNHYLGLSYYSIGAYARAVELLTWNVEALRGELLYERFGLHGVAAVFSRTPLVWSLAERGDFGLAKRRVAEELQIAEASDHPYTLAAALQGAGLFHLRTGSFGDAIEATARAVDVCRTWDIRTVFPIVTAQLGYARALLGNPGDGRTLLSEALAAAEQVRTMMNTALETAWLGEACLIAGDAAGAADHAERALTAAGERGERGAEAWALRLRAEVLARVAVRDVETAATAFREALAQAEELGMRPLQAHCHLGLGTLDRRVGHLEEARAELTTAISMLREMGMAHWLPEAKRELAAAGR